MYFSCSFREAGNYKLSAGFMEDFKEALLCFLTLTESGTLAEETHSFGEQGHTNHHYWELPSAANVFLCCSLQEEEVQMERRRLPVQSFSCYSSLTESRCVVRFCCDVAL